MNAFITRFVRDRSQESSDARSSVEETRDGRRLEAVKWPSGPPLRGLSTRPMEWANDHCRLGSPRTVPGRVGLLVPKAFQALSSDRSGVVTANEGESLDQLE